MEISQQFGFDSAFLSNSGAEAVENAIKICYDYRRNHGYGFCFLGAFHGRTLGALSLNRSKKVHRDWYPQIPKVVELPFCRCRERCDCGWKVYSIGRKGVISRLAQVLDPDIGLIDPQEVAYIIVEPILGEGGYDIANPEFIREVAEIAHREGIPLIADEIQSGLGRTGKWWAVEHFGLVPDIITSAKALRVGATIGKSIFFPREERRISSTWGEGNAISSAVGYQVIQTIQEEGLLKNAEEMGNYFLSGLRQLQSRFPVIYDVLLGEKTKRKPKNPFHTVEKIESLSEKERWDFWKEQLSKCIRCYACRSVCPMCYCDECVVDTITFAVTADTTADEKAQKIKWLEKSPVLSENFVYHFIRAIHLAGRCIDCGECERVCPLDIPIRFLNKKLEKDAKELFDYDAGFDPEQPSLVSSFRDEDPEDFIR